MTHLRASRILAIATALCIATAVLLSTILSFERPYHNEHGLSATLEQRARDRYEAFGELAACDFHRDQWPQAAQRHLAAAGEPAYPVLVAVTPTFSEIMLLGVSPEGVTRYRMPGVTAFGPEFIGAPQLTPQKLASIDVPRDDLLRLSSGLRRNAQYAIGNLQPGLDGVSYYIMAGTDWCAVTWSPQSGISHALVAAVESLLEPEPSAAALREALARLEYIEQSQ